MQGKGYQPKVFIFIIIIIYFLLFFFWCFHVLKDGSKLQIWQHIYGFFKSLKTALRGGGPKHNCRSQELGGLKNCTGTIEI